MSSSTSTSTSRANSSSPSLQVRQDLSLFIPHMFPNITPERVSRVFSSNLIGDVKRVDFVPKTDKNRNLYNSAYIHFHSWCNSITVSNLQTRVLDPNREARIVYDDPWYWIILPNTANTTSSFNNNKVGKTSSTSSQVAGSVPEFFQSKNTIDNTEFSRQPTKVEMMENRIHQLELENAKLNETIQFLQFELNINSNINNNSNTLFASANLREEFQP